MHTISVAMCTYNGEKFIEKQIKSIINQSLTIDEIVICDDCSSDETVNIARSILSKVNIEWKIIINIKNIGVTKNFQNAIENCKGDIIFLSDQDDIWEVNKVKIMYDAITSRDDINVVFSDAYIINEDDEILTKSLWDRLSFQPKDSYNINDFIEKRFVTGATIALRKNFFCSICPFPDSWLHDGWISINASMSNSIKSINYKTIKYRKHRNNVIGVSNGIFSRSMERIRNINGAIYFRVLMEKRFREFLKVNEKKLNFFDKKIVKECILFWNAEANIYKLPFNKKIKTIFFNFYRGMYKKYYNGITSAFLDFYICFFKIRI